MYKKFVFKFMKVKIISSQGLVVSLHGGSGGCKNRDSSREVLGGIEASSPEAQLAVTLNFDWLGLLSLGDCVQITIQIFTID